MQTEQLDMKQNINISININLQSQQLQEWRTIQDFPNYQISQFGNVLNIKTDKLLKHSLSSGYLFVSLLKNNQIKKFYIHKLIGQYFIENSNNYKYIDHINGCKTDNRIQNLRWCTNTQNSMNKQKTKSKTTSIFKGVSFDNNSNKWRPRIKFNLKNIHLGLFENEFEAALVYDKKAKELFKEFVKTNFEYDENYKPLLTTNQIEYLESKNIQY